MRRFTKMLFAATVLSLSLVACKSEKETEKAEETATEQSESMTEAAATKSTEAEWQQTLCCRKAGRQDCNN